MFGKIGRKKQIYIYVLEKRVYMHKKIKYRFILFPALVIFAHELCASQDEKFPDPDREQELVDQNGVLLGEPAFNMQDSKRVSHLGQTPFTSPVGPVGKTGSRLPIDQLKLSFSGDQEEKVDPNKILIEPIIPNASEHSSRTVIKAAGLLGLTLIGIIKYNQEAKESARKLRSYAKKFWKKQNEKPLTRGFIARTVFIFSALYYLYN